MDYTLSTFLPECSLSQEPKSRDEIENKVGLPPSSTSMPLLMHLILSFQKGATGIHNASPDGPKINNLMDHSASADKKNESPVTDNLLWSDKKNMDIKQHLDDSDDKKVKEEKKVALKPQEDKKIAEKQQDENTHKNLTSLNDLPPLTQKKGGLQPLDFNPKEDTKKFSDSVESEKKKLAEVDKKLKEFQSDSAFEFEAPKQSPDRKAKNIESKQPKKEIIDDYDDDFEDDILEDLPVEDIYGTDHKEKDPFGESGVSASQSMGMDPSVTSLDIEGYDHVEQAIINSPYKS